MHSTFKRPFKPIEFTPGTIECFDFQSLADQLRMEEPYIEHGRSGLTLTRDHHHTMVLTVAKAGKIAHEYNPLGPTTIVMISGSVTLMTDETAQKVPLMGGMAAAFAPDVTHRIEAHADSVFLIIIGGNQ